MGWAHGRENGRDVGYGVPDICNLEGCEQKIDRGLSFRCGGVTNLHDDYGCGNFFCGAHMSYGSQNQLCETCVESDPIDDEE